MRDFCTTVSPEEYSYPGSVCNSQESDTTANPLKILLVEDSPDNCILVQYYMKTTPHHLDIADNGQAAVVKAKASEYDLILMDIQMPVMDGYEATREIRAWEEMNSRPPVPIVAQTACCREEDVSKILASGFDAHMPKPIKETTLLTLIGQYSTAS